MSGHSLRIVIANLQNDQHARDICLLVNAYASDPMGRGKPLDAAVLTQLIPGLLATPTCVVLLAYAVENDNEKPAGIAVCFRGFSTFNARPLLNIHDFAVIGEFRGRGIGQQLMEAVFAVAREFACCKVTLEVSAQNLAAQRLYLRCGFTPGDATTTAQAFWTREIT